MVESLLQTTYKVAAFFEKDPGCQQELSYLRGPLTCPTDHLSSLIFFRRRDHVTVTQVTLAHWLWKCPLSVETPAQSRNFPWCHFFPPCYKILSLKTCSQTT